MPVLHPSTMHRVAACVCAALLPTLCGCAGDGLRPAPPTVVPELVGTPFTETSFYARNVWDMQLFGGRIWLGHGDTIDNWGPIPIWSLDPATGALAAEYTTDEEQVSVFRVLDGELYAPGIDPRGDWSLGQFYRLEHDGWVRHRTIPHGVHAYDLALYGGRMYVALGTEAVPGQETLLESTDRGESWRVVTDEVSRVYALVELGGELYAARGFWNMPDSTASTMLRLEGGRFVPTPFDVSALLPGIAPNSYVRMVRATPFRGALAFVVARNPSDWIPEALGVTADLREVRRVTLPDSAALPYDLLVRGDTLFALAAAPAPGGGYTVEVHATADAVHWREVLRFAAPTFARSFEESGGDFFFGLGCTYDAPSPAAGQIIRVRRPKQTAR